MQVEIKAEAIRAFAEPLLYLMTQRVDKYGQKPKDVFLMTAYVLGVFLKKGGGSIEASPQALEALMNGFKDADKWTVLKPQ